MFLSAQTLSIVGHMLSASYWCITRQQRKHQSNKDTKKQGSTRIKKKHYQVAIKSNTKLETCYQASIFLSESHTNEKGMNV